MERNQIIVQVILFVFTILLPLSMDGQILTFTKSVNQSVIFRTNKHQEVLKKSDFRVQVLCDGATMRDVMTFSPVVSVSFKRVGKYVIRFSQLGKYIEFRFDYSGELPQARAVLVSSH